jgi:hypothetical protein
LDGQSIGWQIASLLASAGLAAWGTTVGSSSGALLLMFSPLPVAAIGVLTIPGVEDAAWRVSLSGVVGAFAGACILIGGVQLLHGRANAQSAQKGDVMSGEPAPPSSLSVGDESVVVGRVAPNTRVGNRSTIVGATDDRGNTILNTPMAIGHGAYAGPGSVAIGTGAGSGARATDDKK